MTRSRLGFTLLEVIVAITITGLALTTAGMALAAARDTMARLETHGARTEADGRVRALLTDMLRHAPLPEQVDAPLLSVDRSTETPVLRFLSVGVRAPYGTGATWVVEVALRDGELRVQATPTGRDLGALPLAATLTSVRGFDVRVLEHASAGEVPAWRAEWPLAQDRPSAIELTWQHLGEATPRPLRVVLSPLERPRS